MLVSTMMDELKMKRHNAVFLLSATIFILGIPSALSFGEFGGFKIFGLSWFDTMDFLSANILLPFGGMMVAVFMGWYLKKQEVMNELFYGVRDTRFNRDTSKVWYFLVKYIAPILILLVFLSSIGVIK
jgi:NSS family neurotransmitter:Na+ symporter